MITKEFINEIDIILSSLQKKRVIFKLIYNFTILK